MRVFRRSGFTLVELLVVIAIIAVLAGLLLPVLSRAKSKANNTVCLSNSKQWGTALTLYVNENDDKLPNDGSATGSSKQDAWYVDLPRLMKQPAYFELSFRTNTAPPAEKSVWICPSNRGGGTGKNFWHYQVNANINGTGDLKEPSARITSIPHPVKTIWMFDAKQRKPFIEPVKGQRNALQIDLHNKSGMNFVYIDGHASFEKAEDYFNPQSGFARTDNPSIIWRPLGDQYYK